MEADNSLNFTDLESMLDQSPGESLAQPGPGESYEEELESPQDESSAPTAGDLELAQLSESLGIPVESLYERLKIPLGNGEAMTLGEYKDSSEQLRRVDTLSTELRQNQAVFESEMTQARQNLGNLISLINPQNLGQEQKQAIEAALTRDSELREQSTLRIIPEWKDPTAKQADLKIMGEFVEKWGGKAQDIQGMTPFYRNMIRHFALQEQKVASIKQKQPRQGKAAKPTRAEAAIGDRSGNIVKKVQSGQISSDKGVQQLGRLLR